MQITRSPRNLHAMVPAQACIQGVLKVKVEVKGRVIRALSSCHKNCYFSPANGSIATKHSHEGPRKGLHPECPQGHGQGQRSRNSGTFVMSRKSLILAQSARSPPILPTIISRQACVQGVLKVEVEVIGHVTQARLSCTADRIRPANISTSGDWGRAGQSSHSTPITLSVEEFISTLLTRLRSLVLLAPYCMGDTRFSFKSTAFGPYEI